jgi:uroporphyrinogen-III synthase
MRLIAAREASAAEDSAARLRAMGHEAAAAPVSRVVYVPWSGPAPAAQALAFTSRHGVAAFAAARPERALPCFTVGPTTAAEARAQGFAQVIEGPADGAALAALLAARLRPQDGAVLHLGGERLAFDLAAALRGAGFESAHAALYRTLEARALSVEAEAALRQGADGVLVYSPRGAAAFAGLCRESGLWPVAAGLRWWCLSAAVAQAARDAGALQVLAAAAPREEALFALLQRGVD